MENNSNNNFSEGFLNKLLESAIEYYNIDTNNEPLENTFSDPITAIDNFKNALKFEAHISMQKEILKNDDPILHAINLNSSPGIISGKNKDKYTVHKKAKAKKDKTPEQIEKEIARAKERLEKRELAKQQRLEEKELEKKEKNDIKEGKKEIKTMQQEVDKTYQKANEYKNSYNDYKEEYDSLDSPKEHHKKKLKTLEERADEIVKHYENLLQSKNEKETNINTREKVFNDKIEERKALKKQKAEERKQILEEKRKIREEKRKQKEAEIAKQKDLEHANDMNLYDELFDLMIEASKIPQDVSNTTSSSVSLDNVKLYESPLPYYRHINSLNETAPNNLLLPALLEGKKVKGDAFIKIYHGPPGTGKTYTIMNEIQKIQDEPKHFKILVCAPSNIAVLNMYERAIDLGIECSIIVSSKNMPEEAYETNDLLNHKVVFSTISMRFGSKLRNIQFSTVFMDEAAQCMEAWVWGLLRPELKYIYMAGDPHQLPALVSEDGIELNHNKSMMERLMELDYESSGDMILLSTQRRMHPDIVAFSNKMYYDNKLKTDYKPLKGNNEKPFEIININSKEERIGTSYVNKEEAKKCIELYQKYKNNKLFEKVIIISPYNAQCNYLRSLDSSAPIHTVDSFQGHEADVVILTTVRTETIGFWADYRRLNVAMTRAKHVLRIVGNTKSWLDGPLNDLIKFYQKN